MLLRSLLFSMLLLLMKLLTILFLWTFFPFLGVVYLCGLACIPFKLVFDWTGELDIFTYFLLLFLRVLSSGLRLNGSFLLVLTVANSSPSVVGSECSSRCFYKEDGTLCVSVCWLLALIFYFELDFWGSFYVTLFFI